MSGDSLQNLSQWDDEKYAFYLGKIHGRYRLQRAKRPVTGAKDSRFIFCEKHASWEGPLLAVTGIKALAWASKKSRRGVRGSG